MRELERRARALGLSWLELARKLGISRTQLAHIRSGRDRFSLGTLHRIADWFPNDKVIQRLVWDYLLHDVETEKERRLREQTLADNGELHAQRLTEPSVALLRAFLADLPRRIMSGTGLLVSSPDTTALSAALGFLEGELRARHIHPIRHAANARLAASAIPTLLAAPVLLVERVEYASPSMAEVLRKRAEFLKVTVATTAENDGVDERSPFMGSRMSRTPIEGARPVY
jgi:transcriptional regulator with XRE-family HTH domain